MKLKNTGKSKKRFLVAIVAMMAVVMMMAAGCKKKEAGTTDEETTTTTVETTTVKVADKDGSKVKSPLTGLMVSKNIAKRRPVAVMINNISESLPQSGIGNASVIYEAPVEGGITRLMALFENYKDLEKIGSIRSCRIYYCYFALEWDALYCHYGQSKYALDFLKSDAIDNIGSYNAGGFFYQTSDRYAPHNTYIGEEGLDNAIKELGYRRNHEDDYKARFEFADKGKEVDLKEYMPAKTVEIAYPHNYPYFQYDKDSKTYLRYQRDEKHIDDQTNEQLSCKNIIIQFVDNTMYDDGKSLDIAVTGEGKGYFITNGNAMEINWSKDELLGITKYTDAKTGKEIVLNPGKSWFCIVQNSTNVTISE